MTDALVEAGGKAISNAVDPNTGDPIGVTIHMSEGFAYGDGEIEQQLVAVHKTCRAAFTAALQAIEAAGYRVVPVEATDPVPTNPVFDQEEAIRRAASRVGEG